MKYDKIAFEVTVTSNESYEEDLKEWYREGGWEEDKPEKEFINVQIKLNDELRGYHICHWTELVDTRCKKDCYGYWYWYADGNIDKEVQVKDQGKHSLFYPFTCSCGIAGCAGIFDGVHLKVRGRSVEWRVKKGMGYDFLPKRFYSFNKDEYFNVLGELEIVMKRYENNPI